MVISQWAVTYVLKHVIFKPGQARVLFITAIISADIGGSLMDLLVGIPMTVREEEQFAIAALEGSLSGVSSDVRLHVSNLFELHGTSVKGTHYNSVVVQLRRTPFGQLNVWADII